MVGHSKPMNPKLLLAVVFCWPFAAAAQSAAGPVAPSGVTPAAGKSAGVLNEWLREQSGAWAAWDVGGQVRVRFESRQDLAVPGLRPEAVDFRKEGGADNSYLLLREKVHVGYAPADWVSGFVEARDSWSHSDARSPDPESDRLDLHQAFLSVGNAARFPLTLKAGRQELAYGDERLAGAFDWNNIGRVFDAAKVRYHAEGSWVDAFVGRVVIPDDNNFNVANDYDVFSGLYGSTTRLVPWQESQLYFLARNVGHESPNAIGENLPPFMRGASARDIYTVGARVKSLPGKLQGWDYAAELAGQFGDFYSAAAGDRLDHLAMAAHVSGGYTWARTAGSPRLGLEYNYSSGDEDATDNDHGTFDNLFPTNHKFYGYMDMFSWQNMHNVRVSASVKPLAKLTLTADAHGFWLADTSDFFYQANGAPRTAGGYGIRPEANNYVGTELDFVATYAVTPYAAAQAGYGHFFVGDYVRSSLNPVGGATDGNWVYVQIAINF